MGYKYQHLLQKGILPKKFEFQTEKMFFFWYFREIYSLPNCKEFRFNK